MRRPSLNQGDSHIMTLLRAYGCPLYDENGNFTVNSPEGIRALAWIKEMDSQGITPKGAKNLELLVGTKLPEEAAAAIDESCNAALEKARVEFN